MEAVPPKVGNCESDRLEKELLHCAVLQNVVAIVVLRKTRFYFLQLLQLDYFE